MVPAIGAYLAPFKPKEAASILSPEEAADNRRRFVEMLREANLYTPRKKRGRKAAAKQVIQEKARKE